MSQRVWMVVAALIVPAVISCKDKVQIGVQVVPPVPAPLGCAEDKLVSLVRLIEANPSLRGNTQLEMSWEEAMSCLATMQVDTALGETNHTLLPAESHSTVTDIGYATANIYPRHNVWWGAPPAPEGRVMARIESDRSYRRLGLDASTQNYLVVWTVSDPASTTTDPVMVVVNANGVKSIGTAEGGPTYIPHGPITGYTQRPGIDPPALTPRAGSAEGGGLSAAALKCFTNGWKACFIDSATEQVEPRPLAFAGFGIGMPLVRVSPGTTVPWVACSKYGCCCGGTQCHGGS